MKESRFFYVPQAASTDVLPQEEQAHAIKVLRLQKGDEVFLADGLGVFYEAEIVEATAKRCAYRILKELPQQRAWTGRIHLAVAPTKSIDRIEWLVEKATEIGFDEITFLNCQHSERRNIRTDRIEKIVVSAMKQSRKPWKPIVNDLTPFNRFIESLGDSHRFIAHCHEEHQRTDFPSILPECSDGRDVVIMIGPEGDFSPEEVNFAVAHDARSISLGTSRLRTETAALWAVMAAQLSLRHL